MVLALVPGLAHGRTVDETQPVSDIQVKAAFIFNFAKFVQWPADSGPIVIGIVGDDALVLAVTRAVESRTIGGRTIVARRLLASDSPKGCHVLYISNLGDQDTAALLTTVQGGVLTIGETPRFLRDGGMIRMFVEERRMRFQINRRQADAAGLQVSAQLFSLAAK